MNINWSNPLAAFFIVEWIVRIFMIFIVPKKRHPTSANTWLLLIMITPTLGVILFMMFGNPKLPKVRRAKQRVVDSLTRKELDRLKKSHPKIFAKIDDDAHRIIARLATVLGGLPPMNGNSVELLHDYNNTFQQIATDINNAEEYVHVEYFISALDNTTEQVFASIENAVSRGVKVRFIYDRIVSRVYPNHSVMLDRLKNAGVDVRESLPLSLIPGKNFTRPDLRNHRKILVVDGKVAYTGSQNIIDKSYHRKDDIRYEEMVVRLKGPVVWQCNNVFRADWFSETNQDLVDIVEKEDVPKEQGSVVAQVLPSGPSHDSSNNLKFYTSMVYSAKKRVGIVVPYFIPDESFLSALTAAAQRGVEVTIINSEAIDKVLAGHAQRSYYEELLEAGINIYLYKKPFFLHTKQVIIDDDVAIIGSSNLDIRSFELDLEVNMVFYDKEIVKKLDEYEKQYLKKSIKITHEKWLNRSVRHKMLDNLARLTASLQ